MEVVRVPQHLDSMPNVLVFEADEFFGIMFIVGVGMALGYFIIPAVLSYLAYKAIRQAKERTRPEIFLYWAHWMGVPMGFKRPNGRVRFYRGD